MKRFTTKMLVRSGVIAALYAAICYALAPISYGGMQFRVSEALTVLPLFYPEAIIGLTVGCLLANIIGNGILDVVFGTLATLVASILTYLAGRFIKKSLCKIVVGIIPPILVNAIVVPFTFLALTDLKSLYFIELFHVGVGQLTVIATLGILLYYSIMRLRKKNVGFML